jgi:hypothetical protein
MYASDVSLTLQQRIQLFPDYEEVKALFKNDWYDELLLDINVSSLIEVIGNQSPNPYNKLAIALGEGYYYKTDYRNFEGDTYSCTKRVKGYLFVVPNRYRTYMSDLLGSLLLINAPWLAVFEMNIYNGLDEFYVRLADEGAYKCHTSLYVPYQAFVDRDVDAILERNSSYLEWYTHTDELWKAMQTDENVIKFLAEVKKDV